jgi:hypothetical protein
MPRLARYTLNSATAISLILCVAFACLWHVEGHLLLFRAWPRMPRWHFLGFRTIRSPEYGVGWIIPCWALCSATAALPAARLAILLKRKMPRSLVTPLLNLLIASAAGLCTSIVLYALVVLTIAAFYGAETEPSPWFLATSFAAMATGFICGTAFIWRRLMHESRVASRLAAGRCAECGYDLHASPDRCPECGAPTEA